ncbi:hypothetical protein [Hamadaea tsunoensis]|uniref:hypothetical protein n=1 Tax=Hamadaea tsunoensis TaxID=53368 RepID=UPI00040BF688|nr:hypothetical protein [Hamadaea tsunoensis]
MDTRGIRVDLGGLRAFADVLDADSAQGLRPGVTRAGGELQTGARFGARSLSGEVVAGSYALSYALDRAQNNARQMVEAADILVAAARAVLTRYAAADQLTSQDLAKIQKTLQDAATEAQKAYGPEVHLNRGAEI